MTLPSLQVETGRLAMDGDVSDGDEVQDDAATSTQALPQITEEEELLSEAIANEEAVQRMSFRDLMEIFVSQAQWRALSGLP